VELVKTANEVVDANADVAENANVNTPVFALLGEVAVFEFSVKKLAETPSNVY
jgi:hypothetical protein